MARYSFTWFSKLGAWNRNHTYIVISALLIIALIVIYMYDRNPSSQNEQLPVETVPDAGIAKDVVVEKPEHVVTETPPEPEVAVTQKQVDVQPVQTLAAKTQSQPDLSIVQPKPNIKSDPQVTKLFNEAMELVNTEPSKIIQARDTLNEALLMCRDRRQQVTIKNEMAKLAERWLFSKSLFPDDKLTDRYQVKPGDLLQTIGRRHKVPYGILMQINNIRRPQSLQAGQIIKVLNGPFNVKVYRSTFTMDLYLRNTYVRSFPVGLGKPGMETPTGLWRVESGGKLVKPVWTNRLTGRTYRPDDKDYPLGSRWIALEGLEGDAKGRAGFAIHGTKDPEQIGKADSQGCIRLHNGNAILIYNMLIPIHSQVLVQD